MNSGEADLSGVLKAYIRLMFRNDIPRCSLNIFGKDEAGVVMKVFITGNISLNL
jgi:hypothetical protein